jgi:CRP/FNR family cyclic AMP-dependent transcriptional regulator
MRKITNLHNWIAELPEEIGNEVIQRCVTQSLKDGECLYRLGDAADACFQVCKGKLKICTFNQTGQELLHSYLMEGDCVGDWGLIISEPRMNFAFACGDAEVRVLAMRHFNELYDKHPQIVRALNRVMARRLRLMFMLAEDASLLPLQQRLARAIVRVGLSEGQVDDDGNTTVHNVSHDELGKMVGAARQSVGRELKKLELDGSIEIKYGKLIIKDIAAFGARYDKLLSAEPVVPNY